MKLIPAPILCTVLLSLFPATSPAQTHACNGNTQLADYTAFAGRAASGLYAPVHPTLPVVVGLEFHSMNSFTSPIQPMWPGHEDHWTDFLNNEFASVGIQFEMRRRTDDWFSFNHPMSNPRTSADIFAILNLYQSTDVIHIYAVDDMTVGNQFLGGFGTYTICSFGQGIVIRKSSSPDGGFIGYGPNGKDNAGPLVHEMGHIFDLLHLSEEWEDPPGIGNINYAADCPDFSNCASAGDFVCDTPAEPDPSAYLPLLLYTVAPGCNYIDRTTPINQVTVGPTCPGQRYYPNAGDAQVASHNFMAMSPPDCRDQNIGTFTQGQRDRMLAALINFRKSLYDPCVLANPNLIACSGIPAQAGEHFGQSIAISHMEYGEGIAAAIGSPSQNRVYMFHGTSAASLELEQVILGSFSTDRNGAAVSFDGDTLLSGMPDHQLAGFASNGVVQTQRRTGTCPSAWGCWEFHQPIYPPDDPSIRNFGAALDTYGDWAVVSPNDRTASSSVTQTDKVYVYRRNHTGLPIDWTWDLHSVLTPPALGATAPIYFGSDVAISGQNLAVGAFAAPNPNQSMTTTGMVFTYTYDSATDTWVGPVALNVDGQASKFGWDIDLWGDTMIVGAPGSAGLGNVGRAYFYLKQGANWLKTKTLNDPDIGGQFGFSVSMAQNSALVGDPGVSGDGGRVYELSRSPFRRWLITRTFDSPQFQADARFGSAVASSPDVFLVGSDKLDRDGQADSGGAFAFTHSPANPNASMTADATSVTRGQTVNMTIDFGTIAAGKAFVIAGSKLPGPGFNFSLLTVPPVESQEHYAFHSVLSPGTYMNMTLNPNNVVVGPTSGVLDAQGRAVVQFHWPTNFPLAQPTTFVHTAILSLDMHYETTPAVFLLNP